jgi:hypothetical protein
MFREGDRVRLREAVVIGDQAFAAGSVGTFERKREEWAQSSGDETARIAMVVFDDGGSVPYEIPCEQLERIGAE